MVRFLACCILLASASITATAQSCNFARAFNNVGDSITVTATLISTDPNENGEGEPLQISSSGGDFSATIGTYAVPQSFTYTATQADEEIQGFNLGADGDESCALSATVTNTHLLSQGAKNALLIAVGGLGVASGGFWVLAEVCTGSIAGAPICGLPSGLIAAALSTATGLGAFILAVDPIDNKFMQIAVPIFPTIPAVPAGRGIPTTVADAYNALIKNQAQVIAVARALYTSMNRALGAKAARDTVWFVKQVEAVTKYENQLSGLFAEQAVLQTFLQTELQVAGITITLSPSQVLQFEQLVSSSGLPAEDVTALKAFLDTPSDISFANSLAIVQDINAVAGPTSNLLTNPSLINALNNSSQALGGSCTEINLIRASLGQSVGQAGFIPAADVNHDNVINVLDLAKAARALPAGTTCP